MSNLPTVSVACRMVHVHVTDGPDSHARLQIRQVSCQVLPVVKLADFGLAL